MANIDFVSEWIKVAERDPYAALGLSVVADERRLTKRYRQVAKRLHPDAQIGASETERVFAQQVLTKVINPAYQRLKQDNTRSEALATLRFKVRRMVRSDKLNPTFESAQQLLRIPEDEVDGFYENTLTQLATQQFVSTATFHQTLPRLAQLNLILLRRKMGDAVIRPKRTGLVVTPKTPKVANGRDPLQSPGSSSSAPPFPTPDPPVVEPPVINYAEKYGIRARTYLSQRSYNQAIQELREGIKIEPNNVEFHSMLGQAYLMQQKFGMSRVHLKRALALSPEHVVAQKYLNRLETLAQRSTQKTVSTKRGSAKVEPVTTSRDRSWLGRIFNR